MKYLIQLQREGWYFAGFRGPSGKAEIGRIQKAKVYFSEGEALSDLSRMGRYGQRIIRMSELSLYKCGNRINFKSYGSTEEFAEG